LAQITAVITTWWLGGVIRPAVNPIKWPFKILFGDLKPQVLKLTVAKTVANTAQRNTRNKKENKTKYKILVN